MNVALSPEHLKWLKSEVDAGRFGSIDEAVAVAVADLKAISESSLDWARPLVDAARSSVQQGESMSAEEFATRTAQVLDKLRSS